MITIVPLNGEPIEHFEDYNDLFDCITTIENMKLIAKRPSAKRIYWSFTIYPPKQVLVLYAYGKYPSEAMKEAAEENLPLIEFA